MPAGEKYGKFCNNVLLQRIIQGQLGGSNAGWNGAGWCSEFPANFDLIGDEGWRSSHAMALVGCGSIVCNNIKDWAPASIHSWKGDLEANGDFKATPEFQTNPNKIHYWIIKNSWGSNLPGGCDGLTQVFTENIKCDSGGNDCHAYNDYVKVRMYTRDYYNTNLSKKELITPIIDRILPVSQKCAVQETLQTHWQTRFKQFFRLREGGHSAVDSHPNYYETSIPLSFQLLDSLKNNYMKAKTDMDGVRQVEYKNKFLSILNDLCMAKGCHSLNSTKSFGIEPVPHDQPPQKIKSDSSDAEEKDWCDKAFHFANTPYEARSYDTEDCSLCSDPESDPNPLHEGDECYLDEETQCATSCVHWKEMTGGQDCPEDLILQTSCMGHNDCSKYNNGSKKNRPINLPRSL